MKFYDRLKEQKACHEALDWAEGQKSAQAAWDNCPRADWMLWAWGHNVKKNSKQHKELVLACCACARTSLKYIKDKQVKYLVKHSLATTEGWARGENTLEEVIEAKEKCYAGYTSYAADAAYVAAAAAAAIAASAYTAAADNAAFYAAYTAYVDAYYYAANAAYDADNADNADNDRKKALLEMANIIRGIQPKAPKFL